MEWSKFQPFFHESWHNKIRKWVESEDCGKLYTYLKNRSKVGVRILPDSINTFRVFKEVPLNEIKVVLLSYCPYHTMIGGIPCADGIAFSNSLVERLSPSITQFYRGIENDLYEGLNLSYKQDNDLSYLLKEGVFLWNSSLTTEYQKAGKHQELWHNFTKFIIEECLAYTGIPIILIGKDAQFYERYMTPLTHGFILKCEHPAFSARENRDWNTNKVFSKVTNLIKKTNNYDIKWLQEYE